MAKILQAPLTRALTKWLKYLLEPTPNNCQIKSLCNLLLPIEKMVPVLMLLPGSFGIEIGSVRFSMSRCLTLLRAPIFVPHCLDVICFVNVRKDGLMMSVLERLRACFSPLVFAATGGMGPTATTVFRKLASMLVEKRSINYSKCLYTGCNVGFVKIFSDVFAGSLLFESQSFNIKY